MSATASRSSQTSLLPSHPTDTTKHHFEPTSSNVHDILMQFLLSLLSSIHRPLPRLLQLVHNAYTSWVSSSSPSYQAVCTLLPSPSFIPLPASLHLSIRLHHHLQQDSSLSSLTPLSIEAPFSTESPTTLKLCQEMLTFCSAISMSFKDASVLQFATHQCLRCFGYHSLNSSSLCYTGLPLLLNVLHEFAFSFFLHSSSNADNNVAPMLSSLSSLIPSEAPQLSIPFYIWPAAVLLHSDMPFTTLITAYANLVEQIQQAVALPRPAYSVVSASPAIVSATLWRLTSPLHLTSQQLLRICLFIFTAWLRLDRPIPSTPCSSPPPPMPMASPRMTLLTAPPSSSHRPEWSSSSSSHVMLSSNTTPLATLTHVISLGHCGCLSIHQLFQFAMQHHLLPMWSAPHKLRAIQRANPVSSGTTTTISRRGGAGGGGGGLWRRPREEEYEEEAEVDGTGAALQRGALASTTTATVLDSFCQRSDSLWPSECDDTSSLYVQQQRQRPADGRRFLSLISRVCEQITSSLEQVHSVVFVPILQSLQTVQRNIEQDSRTTSREALAPTGDVKVVCKGEAEKGRLVVCCGNLVGECSAIAEKWKEMQEEVAELMNRVRQYEQVVRQQQQQQQATTT
eukprot:GHVS01068367.1.p1 GENE.GHVS01068367.1~~GHVS01068367.1.p1  ORF type:complete len:668 (+),score=138.83 GHVS01068367.1:134-2005(+)